MVLIRHHEQAFWYLNINAMFHLSDLVDYFCMQHFQLFKEQVNTVRTTTQANLFQQQDGQSG